MKEKNKYSLLSEDQISLVKKWKGLTPQKAAIAMCEHFKISFPEWEKYYKLCGEGLWGPGRPLDEVAFPKSNTWEELEANLKQVTRRFVMNEKCFTYWDRMRYLFLYLPGDSAKRITRQEDRKANRKTDGNCERQLDKMKMCSLCWRAVPVRKGVASRTLCQHHSWSSGHPEYKRRYRMRYGKTPQGDSRQTVLIHRYYELLEPLRDGKTVTYSSTRNTNHIQEYRIKDAWNIAPFLIVKLLPNVYEYLLANDADMTSAMSIIQTLEGPLPHKEKDDEVAMRSEFYEDCRFYFRYYVQHLIWAEIWLELDVNTQRGGRRPGAGRKPKK